MIHILYVLNGPFRHGGTETAVLNYYSYIDKTRFHIDFAVHAYEQDCLENKVHQQLIQAGCILYYVTPRSVSTLQNYRDFQQIFSTVHYDIVHSHMDSVGAFVLSIARKYDIKVRIAHSHNTNHQITINSPKKLLHYIYLEYCRYSIRKTASDYMACSASAASWMFGKQHTKDTFILHNAIDAKAYAYCEITRRLIRQELGVADNLVIGHVGRFYKQKNHTFLLDIFQLIHTRIPHSKLLLVGNGPLMEQIQEKAGAQGLTDSIIFYGVTDQVASLMQAMDILVLPSLFEGLGIVSIEAQASGLKVISSTEVPKASSVIDELTTFLPLSAPAQTWSDTIINEAGDPHRYVTTDRISAAGYDISTSVHDLEAYYEQALHRYCS